jgi:hypothetical protein
MKKKKMGGEKKGIWTRRIGTKTTRPEEDALLLPHMTTDSAVKKQQGRRMRENDRNTDKASCALASCAVE